MIIKFFIKLFLITLIIVFQISFINNLPIWARELNLIIIILIFTMEFSSTRKTIWWFLVVGFLFDIYFSPFFGLFIFLWPIVFLFSKFLSSNFLTNKSLYSFLGLTFFTVIFYNFTLHLFVYTIKVIIGENAVFFLFIKNFYVNLLFSVALNVAVVFVIFYMINFISSKLKPVFLFKR